MTDIHNYRNRVASQSHGVLLDLRGEVHLHEAQARTELTVLRQRLANLPTDADEEMDKLLADIQAVRDKLRKTTGRLDTINARIADPSKPVEVSEDSAE